MYLKHKTKKVDSMAIGSLAIIVCSFFFWDDYLVFLCTHDPLGWLFR